MREFRFDGRIPSSKSLLNRSLVIRSHASRGFLLKGDSDAEDVIFLRKALGKIEDGKEFYLGDGGTTLRFFALRAAREKGTFTLKVSERLFERPQGALKEILHPFGVSLEPGANLFVMRSNGWQNPGEPLRVPTGDSSQFASAVILNAWNLPYDLEIRFEGTMTSPSYFNMTLALCRQAGMEIVEKPKELFIPANQKVNLRELQVEPDVSSMFSIAALAALGGEAIFRDVPLQILQPDLKFLEFFKRMGIPCAREGSRISVGRGLRLQAIEADLADCPDLAPVLAVVCAFAEGKSVLKNAPQLRHKESDRIRSTAKLLAAMGIQHQERPDGLEIEGQPSLQPKSFSFDPDRDHRLAMAAGILMRLGWDIRLSDPEAVDKSFPEFWHVLGTGPHLLMGHRGTGKSSLLNRLEARERVDLDTQIEHLSGQSVFDLIGNRGEEVFRQWELKTLKEVLREASPHAWVAVGAGFRWSDSETRAEKLWLRRDTDREGRVFLDRPRLDPSSDPLVEFRLRAKDREPVYSRYADRIYTIPEGLHGPDEIEDRILSRDFEGTGGVVTMLPMHRRGIPQLGADLYELRDDLLDKDETKSLFHKLPEEKILYSVRREPNLPWMIQNSKCQIDWGLDVGYPEKELIESLTPRLTLSSHGTLKEALLDFRLFGKHAVHLKMSPLIESFEDLKAGHLWWSQDPENRSFLPRSADGRWGWYRLWMKGRSKLNFWREGTGSSFDQPTLYQWLASPLAPKKFAAVLGSPVHHSWTPSEHRRFFAEEQIPVWAIDVREGEWHKAFPFLEELGLRFAAVTSPLKGRAFRSSRPSSLAAELQSVNTLVYDETDRAWRGHNTDLMGLQESAADLPVGPVAIWGGGGTLPVLGRVLPNAAAYSATAGHLREGSKGLSATPKVVVWAAPRGPELKWPPTEWKPDLVLDLNYKEDSPGREYALRCKAVYRSGEAMFGAQARGQRDFWETFLKGKPQ